MIADVEILFNGHLMDLNMQQIFVIKIFTL